jgi:hypothetical protein
LSSIYALDQGGQTLPADQVVEPIRSNIRRAREHRKGFEAVWQSNMAFAAGQHWLVWDPNFRALRKIQDVDPRYRRRKLYQADAITEYRTQVLGELGSDDDRPELLLQHDDQTAEDFQAQVNRAVGYGWDFEWDGDGALAESDRLCVDLGTSAIQVYFDPSYGQVKAQDVPHMNGKPLLGQEEAMQAVASSFLGGPQVTHQPIKEGRICWRALSALNLLPPPGVTHEKYFPFDCVVYPMPLAAVQAIYGDTTANLQEDRDISSTLGDAAVGPNASSYATGGARKNTLRNHVWLFIYFERPGPASPNGRVYHFAGNQMKLLRMDDKLPYQAPDGSYRSGVTYFHWWRVTGRFWSRSLVEVLKDGQRAKNERRTQAGETIDRGQPYTLVQTGSKAKKRTDLPLEIVEIDATEKQPVHIQGIGPGTWMYEELNQIKDDMERAAGVRAASLGENPSNVANYSQLALLRETDQVKRQPILYERKLGIKRLVEDSVFDIKTYWGADKQVYLAGEEERVEAEVFNATKIPAFYMVKVAKGTAKPRSQAAELQKITDIWNAALAAQIVTTDPAGWTRWFKDSLEHGEALDLPEDPKVQQFDKAKMENDLLTRGAQVPVAYYDPSQIHIPVHRDAQIQAELSGDVGTWQRIEKHIQEHEQNDAQNAQQVAQIQATAPPPQDPNQPQPPQGPPGPPPGGAPNAQ